MKAVETQIMRKFVNNQRLRNTIVLANPLMLSVLPLDSLSNKQNRSSDELDLVGILDMSLKPLNSISSFSIDGGNQIRLLPPLHEDVLTSELQKALDVLYCQLYPNYNFEASTPFYVRSGRVVLCGQVIKSLALS